MHLDGQAGRLQQVALRHDRLREAELRRLTQASLESGDGAPLTGETHLAEDHDLATHRPVHVARRRRYEDGEIGRWLRDPTAAGDVDEDVLTGQWHTRTLLEDGEEQADAIVVGTEHRTAWRTERRGRNQCFQPEQQRTRAFETGDEDRPGDAPGPPAQEEPRGVLDLEQAALGHLEDADPVGRAEA